MVISLVYYRRKGFGGKGSAYGRFFRIALCSCMLCSNGVCVEHVIHQEVKLMQALLENDAVFRAIALNSLYFF